MTIKVTIRNDEAEGSARVLALTVVTVGNLAADETKKVLAPQESAQVSVGIGQFVMVDESDRE